MNGVLRRSNRGEPRGVVLLRVFQETNAVGVAQRRAGCARERLIGQLARDIASGSVRAALRAGSGAMLSQAGSW